MWLLGKENAKKLSSVIHNKYYSEWVTYLEKLLRYSKQKKYYKDPVNLLGLEFALQKTLSQMEALVAEGKSRKNEAEKKGKKDEVEDLEIGININRQLGKIIKTIADGLAWRVLDYDRPFLRMMAESRRYFGSVTPEAYKGVEEAVLRLVSKHGTLILINDITNFLRFGDITEVGERTVIHEVKKKGKELKSVYTIMSQHPKAKTSQQMKRIVQAQIARDYREVVTPSETNLILDIPIRFQNNLPKVKRIIQASRKNMFASHNFGDYLFVTCQDTDKIVNTAIETNENVWEKFNDKPGWDKSDVVLPYSNLDNLYDFGGDFFRNSTPYSIYPFSTHDCMGLLSGKLFLKSQLNISAIKRMLERNGWQVTEVDIDERLKENKEIEGKLFTGEVYEHVINDTIFIIKRGAFNMNIAWGWITRISTDFMKPEVLLDEVEYVYRTSNPTFPRKFATSLPDEKNVWK